MYFLLGIFTVFILLCWLGGELITRSNLKNQNNPVKYSLNRQLKLISNAIDGLDGFQFEEFISYMFNLGGMKAKTTPKTRDGGKDVIVKDKQGTIYVECKHYAENNKITVNLIHKLISACVVDEVKRGIFITTSNFSKESIDLADRCKQVDIQIWYKSDVLDFCKSIDRMELLEWLGYDKDEVLKYCTISA
jgi:HJR/Mrr/RecB family endonuclease